VIPLQARCGLEDRGTRRGWVVSSTPRPYSTPGIDPVPILQEAGWAPVPVWTGGKSRPHRDSIPDHPARSQSLYRLSYPAHINFIITMMMMMMMMIIIIIIINLNLKTRLAEGCKNASTVFRTYNPLSLHSEILHRFWAVDFWGRSVRI